MPRGDAEEYYDAFGPTTITEKARIVVACAWDKVAPPTESYPVFGGNPIEDLIPMDLNFVFPGEVR
jgi:hypothetical protein